MLSGKAKSVSETALTRQEFLLAFVFYIDRMQEEKESLYDDRQSEKN